MISPRFICRASIAALLSISFASAQAQIVWNGTTNALWDTPENWSTSAKPILTDDVVFPAPIPASGSTITLTAGEVANTLHFQEAYTLSGGTLALTLGTVTVAPTFNATIGSQLVGTAGLTKGGAGTLTLTGANTYTGKTVISAGTLSISSDGNLGTAPATAVADQLTLSGGTLKFTAATTLSANRGLTISGGGTTSMLDGNGLAHTISGGSNIVGASTVTLANSSGTASTFTFAAGGSNATTLGAAIVIDSNVTVNLGNNSTTGNISGNTAALTVNTGGILRFNRNNGTAYNAPISGAGAVNIANNTGQVVTLNPLGTALLYSGGQNTYSGGTNIGGSNATALGTDNSSFGTGSINFVQGAGGIGSADANARTFANNISVTSPATSTTITFGQTSGGTGALTLSGNVSIDRAATALTRTFATNVATTFSGIIADSGAATTAQNIAFSGGGTRTLTGANTFIGNLSWNQGLVLVQGANGTVSGASQITVGDAGGADESITIGNLADVVLTGGGVNRLGDSSTLILNGTGPAIFNGPATGSSGFTETLGTLSVPVGRGFVTLNPSSGESHTLAVGTLNRSSGTTLFVRGTGLGGTGADTTRVVFTNAPTLVGGAGTAGSQTVSVVPFILGDDSSTGTGKGFVTHDAATGLRLLTDSEYDSSLTGAGTQRNVSLGTTATYTGSANINALRVRAGTSTISGNVSLGSNAIVGLGGTVDGAGAINFGSGQGIIQAGGGAVTSLNTRLAGSGGLVVGGGSTGSIISLGGSNTLSGTVTVTTDGRLRLTSSNAFNPLNAPTLNLYSNGRLQVAGGVTTTVRDLAGASGGSIENGVSGAATVNVLSQANTTWSGGFNNTAGTLAVVKRGAGVLTLNNNSSNFTGAFALERGEVTLSAGTRFTGTTAVSIGGSGILRLTNSSSGTNNQGDRINSSAVITMRGGTFDFDNNATSGQNYAETVGALNSFAGTNIITNDTAATGNSSVLTFNGAFNRAAGSGTFFFSTGNNTLGTSTLQNRVVFTTAPTLNDGLIGGNAYYGTSEFASYSADVVAGGTAEPSVVLATYTTNPAETAYTTSVNAKHSTAGVITLTAPRTVNSLHIAEGVGLALGNNQLTVDAGGILSVATTATTTGGANSIAGGSLTAGALDVGGDLAIRLASAAPAALVISADIVNNGIGAVTLTKNGSGALTLSGSNTYSGATSIIAGQVNIDSDARLGSAPSTPTAGHLKLYTGVLNVTSAGQTLSANRGLELGGSSATITAPGTGGALVYNGSITSTAQTDLTVNGSVSLGSAANPLSNLQVGGNLNLAGAASVTIGGTNNSVGGAFQIGNTGASTSFTAAAGTGAFTVGLATPGVGTFDVGFRNVTAASVTTSIVDLTNATSFTAGASAIRIGVLDFASGSSNRAELLLPASAALSAAGSVTIGDNVNVSNGGVAGQTSKLAFGSGASSLTSGGTILVGGRKGDGQISVASGGTLTLGGFALNQPDLVLARNNANTGTVSKGILDATGATLVASLNNLVVGDKSGGAGGGAYAEVKLGSSSGTSLDANAFTLATISGAAADAEKNNLAYGIFTQENGNVLVRGNANVAVTDGANGSAARGDLILKGGTFTVGGDLGKSDSVGSVSNITLEGGNLDLRDDANGDTSGGSITASTLTYRSGSVTDAASITLDGRGVSVLAAGVNNLTDATNQRIDTVAAVSDALTLRDVTLSPVLNLTAAAAGTGGVRYDATGAGGGATLSGAVNLGSADRTFNVEDSAGAVVDLTIAGAVTGNVLLTKTGAGTLALNATVAGPVTVADGTLGGSGTISGAVNVAANATLAPGNSPGTLTTGSLTLDGASSSRFELTLGNTTAGGGINDLVIVSGDLALDGTLFITELGGSLSDGSTYVLFDYSGVLTDGGLNIDSAFLAAHPLASIQIDTVNTQVLLSVPEPGTAVAMLSGAGMLLGLQRRRRTS